MTCTRIDTLEGLADLSSVLERAENLAAASGLSALADDLAHFRVQIDDILRETK